MAKRSVVSINGVWTLHGHEVLTTLTSVVILRVLVNNCWSIIDAAVKPLPLGMGI